MAIRDHLATVESGTLEGAAGADAKISVFRGVP